MNIILLSILIIHLKSLLVESDTIRYNQNKKIRELLLKTRNYDKHSLPTIREDENNTATVHIRMTLRNLRIDEDTEVMAVNAWIIMIWNDERLKYDQKDYGGVGMVHFGDDELWKPDFTLYNNAKMTEVDHYGNVHLLTWSNGEVLWVPPASLEFGCPLNLKYWPFDIQTCVAYMGSWTTHGWQIYLNLMGSDGNSSKITIDKGYQTYPHNWKVLSAIQEIQETIYPCCREPYHMIKFTFTVQRVAPSFSTVVIIPALVIPIFLLLQFILPVDHPKRITIGCCCFIVVLLELLFLKYSLPKVATDVPLIVSYYGEFFFLVMFTVALSACLGCLSHPQNPIVAYAPPELIKRISTGIPATLLLLRSHADKVGLSSAKAEDGEVLESSKDASYLHEWQFLAKLADRICFLVLIVIYIFSLLAYVVPHQ